MMIVLISLAAISLQAFAGSPSLSPASPEDIRADISKVVLDTVAKKNPGYPRDAISVSFKSAEALFSMLSKRSGNLTFAIVDENIGFNPVGNSIVPVQIYVDGVAAEKVHLQTKVRVVMDVVVAAKKLGKQKILAEDDLAISRQDIGPLPKTFFTARGDAVGKQLLSSLSTGTVILDWMLRVPPIVSKSDEVEIVVESDSLTVSARGVALEDGYKGDRIKVKNADTKKEVKATVVEAHLVKVEI